VGSPLKANGWMQWSMTHRLVPLSLSNTNKDKNTGAVDQGFTYNFKKISILQKINSKYFQFPTFNIYLQPQ